MGGGLALKALQSLRDKTYVGFELPGIEFQPSLWYRPGLPRQVVAEDLQIEERIGRRTAFFIRGPGFKAYLDLGSG